MELIAIGPVIAGINDTLYRSLTVIICQGCCDCELGVKICLICFSRESPRTIDVDPIWTTDADDTPWTFTFLTRIEGFSWQNALWTPVSGNGMTAGCRKIWYSFLLNEPSSSLYTARLRWSANTLIRILISFVSPAWKTLAIPTELILAFRRRVMRFNIIPAPAAHKAR